MHCNHDAALVLSLQYALVARDLGVFNGILAVVF
jgi:hypothetical protein